MDKLIAYFEGAAKELQESIKEAEECRVKIPTYLVDAQINAALIRKETENV